MKKRFTFSIVLVLITGLCVAQSDSTKLATTIHEFHEALVNGNLVSINQQTDKALSYGHSMGMVETKNDLIRHLKEGMVKYKSFTEDSLQIVINNNMANARFIANIQVVDGDSTKTINLSVLEVWVKKGNRWLLFARQGIKRS